jgi:outer membrane lipoprotein-sorting protein
MELQAMKWVKVTAATLAALALLSSSVWSQAPEEKGYQIAKKAHDKDKGYRDYTATGKMILRNRAGAEAVRDFDFKIKESGGGDHSLLVFNWPGDIRDTALLTHGNRETSDDQWIFLPAERRVKRIVGSGRSGSFVGSEFAYEDMLEQELAKFGYRWLSDEACCHVVERTPKTSSGYSKQRVWYNKSNYTVAKIEYYNRGGTLLKVMSAAGYRQYNGRFWRPATMTMLNRLTGKQTTLSWSKYRFAVGLDAGDFTTRALERVR